MGIPACVLERTCVEFSALRTVSFLPYLTFELSKRTSLGQCESLEVHTVLRVMVIIVVRNFFFLLFDSREILLTKFFVRLSPGRDTYGSAHKIGPYLINHVASFLDEALARLVASDRCYLIL